MRRTIVLCEQCGERPADVAVVRRVVEMAANAPSGWNADGTVWTGTPIMVSTITEHLCSECKQDLEDEIGSEVQAQDFDPFDDGRD